MYPIRSRRPLFAFLLGAATTMASVGPAQAHWDGAPDSDTPAPVLTVK